MKYLIFINQDPKIQRKEVTCVIIDDDHHGRFMFTETTHSATIPSASSTLQERIHKVTIFSLLKLASRNWDKIYEDFFSISINCLISLSTQLMIYSKFSCVSVSQNKGFNDQETK